MTRKANERVLELTGVQAYTLNNILNSFAMSGPRFNKGSVYLAIRKNLRTLARVLETLEETRVQIAREIDPEGGEAMFTGRTHPDPDTHDRFVQKYKDVLDTPQRITLVPIEYDAMDLGTNHIAIRDLDVLMDCGLVYEEIEDGGNNIRGDGRRLQEPMEPSDHIH